MKDMKVLSAASMAVTVAILGLNLVQVVIGQQVQDAKIKEAVEEATKQFLKQKIESSVTGALIFLR